MIHLKNVTAGYGTTPIIRNIDWKIQPGQHWAIVGKIGSGKSTLQKAIAGKTRILSGDISYDFLQNPKSFDARKKAVQLVSFTDSGKLFNSVNAVHYYQQRYQAFDSDGHLTVLQYLEAHGLQLSNTRHRQFIENMNIQDLLKLERIKLSSGQLRKILLLKIILLQPQFLLLDNAHLGLDHQSRQVLNDYIDLLVSQDNQQIIMSGHFRSLPKCITHVLHLEKGQISGIQSVGEYMADKQAINAAPELPVSIPNYFARSVNEPFKRVLHFADISIKYKNTSVLEKLNWTVKKGEKWTLQGPNGVGKSTLISLIYADHPQAYSNKIQLFDKARGSGESIWDIKKRIGFSSPELHSFFNFNFETLSVILSGLYDTFYLGKYSDEQRQAAESLLQYFDISEHLYAPFHNLSTGTQRVILLLRALIKRPPVLLLDEPYQGLDQDTIHQCNHLLCEILTEQHTLIFISHFDDEVPAIIKKQLILN